MTNENEKRGKRTYYPCTTYGYNDHSNEWKKKRKRRLKEKASSADLLLEPKTQGVENETHTMSKRSLPERDGESR